LKVAILFFSPTGNTRKVARMIAEKLEEKGVAVQCLELSRKPELFDRGLAGKGPLASNETPKSVVFKCVFAGQPKGDQGINRL